MDRKLQWTAALAAIVLCFVTGNHSPLPVMSSAGDSGWRAGTWYALQTNESPVRCELPATGERRFLLVLGCLGDAAQHHEVRLRRTPAQPDVASTRPIEMVRLAPETSQRPSEQFGPDLCRDRLTLNSPVRQQPSGERLKTREFFLHVTDGDLGDARQYAKVQARVVGQGQRVRVWLDQQLDAGAVPADHLNELIETLETDVLPRVESQFGRISDVDQDGWFSVVLSPWLSRLQGGRVSIGGMVRGSDFRLDVAPPFGNRCDMLFLNSQLPAGPALADLLSHEVAHAACISQRLMAARSRVEEQDWLSEALAHLAEPGWTNRDHRVVEFLHNPAKFPLVVPDYYRAGLWRNPGCRGATFLFANWNQAHNDAGFCRRLTQSSAVGTANLERATAQNFEDLFRCWTLSLAEGEAIGTTDLLGTVGRYELAGIRRHFWATSDPELRLSMRGSAFAVVELRLDAAVPQELQIDTDSHTPWQFSLRQLAPHELDVAMNVGCDTLDSPGAPSQRVVVELSERTQRPIELCKLVFERRNGEVLESVAIDPDELHSAVPSETSRQPNHVRRVVVERVKIQPGEWTVKGVVLGENGESTFVWRELNVPRWNNDAVIATAK